MNIITINDVKGYLGTDLEGIYDLRDVRSNTFSKEIIRSKKLRTDNVDFFLEYCKPLLWPLDFLTKEIPFEGKMIVPIVEMAKLFHKNEKYNVTHYDGIKFFGNERNDNTLAQVNCCVENDSSRYMYYMLKNDILKWQSWYELQWLLEHHFDIFGLIPRGLALSKENFKL